MRQDNTRFGYYCSIALHLTITVAAIVSVLMQSIFKQENQEPLKPFEMVEPAPEQPEMPQQQQETLPEIAQQQEMKPIEPIELPQPEPEPKSRSRTRAATETRTRARPVSRALSEAGTFAQTEAEAAAAQKSLVFRVCQKKSAQNETEQCAAETPGADKSRKNQRQDKQCRQYCKHNHQRGIERRRKKPVRRLRKRNTSQGKVELGKTGRRAKYRLYRKS